MKQGKSFQFIFAAFALIAVSSWGNASEFDIDDSTLRHIGYPDWFKSSLLSLDDDIEDARDSGKLGLMLLFTTDGCAYCDVFIRKSLGDPELARLTRETFDSIGFEIFDDSEMTAPDGTLMPVKQFAKQVGVEFSPTLVFLDTEGKLLLKLTGYQSPQRYRIILNYFREGHYQKVSVRDYARQLAQRGEQAVPAKPMRSDPLFSSPPYMLDRSIMPATMPLFVLFESNSCDACEQFHDQVLADQALRKLLGGFEIVQLDMNDNDTTIIRPDGKRSTPKEWFDENGMEQLPAMLFFDEKGNEVLRTDTLVFNQRMENSLNFVLERAYEKGWNYQRFARTKAIERLNNRQQ